MQGDLGHSDTHQMGPFLLLGLQEKSCLPGGGGDLSLMSQFWLNCSPLGSTAPAVAKVLTVLWLLCYPVGALYIEGFSLTLSGSNS